MKTIGLLGGMSWESSAQYYAILNREAMRRLGHPHSARVAMLSVDFGEVERLQHVGEWDALGAMLAEQGGDVRVGGNIGVPAISQVEGSTAATTFVWEVSSFQLEGTDRFHPHLAVFTNLSPDHLDRHRSFDDYAEAKAKIFTHQTAGDFAVVNGSDAGVLPLAARTAAHTVRFAADDPGGDAAFFAADHAVLRRGSETGTLFPRSAVRLPGAHLAEDLLTAAAAARLLGASADAITRAVSTFRGIEHVMELVADEGGVRWFNDSKATNPDAARRAVEAFAGPLFVIMGGRFKGGDLAVLAPALTGRTRAVLAIGEARPLLREALASTVEVVDCASLEEAIAHARREARPGDTVLFAPACASFDMFVDYAARGRAFKALVGANARGAA